MEQEPSWSTRNELSFIEGLGAFGVNPKPRRKALLGYLKGASKRETWGTIDKDKVLDTVAQELLNQ